MVALSQGYGAGARPPASTLALDRRRVIALGTTGIGAVWTAACRSGGPAKPAEQAPAQRTVSGTLLMWCNPNFPFSEDVGGEIAQEFSARYPNVKFTADSVPGNMVEKLTTAVAGGVPPDLSHVDIYTPASLAASGATISLENYLKTSRELKKTDLWPTHVADCSYNGQLVAVPFGPDLRVLYIYKNHYDALGWTSRSRRGAGQSLSR